VSRRARFEAADMRRWLLASQWEASFHLAVGNVARFVTELECIETFARAIGIIHRRSGLISLASRWN
jgi:hypothetical protein